MIKVVTLAIAGSLTLISSTTTAATSSFPVTKAPFPVQFNGVTINNQTAQYPLLLHKNITYVPMTWDYCQSLALQVNWSQETGLEISKLPPKGIEVKPETTSRDQYLEKASIPTFPIKVNGKSIDNANETYPILVYKDITYFPLTWRFVHDEFGWVTNWNSTEGLRIETDQEQILNNILYEDDSYLYLDTSASSLIKVAKNLQSDPIPLNISEAESIKIASLKSSGATIISLLDEKNEKFERVGNTIRYGGTDIMDLSAVKSVSHDPIGFKTKIADDMDLVVVGAQRDDADSEKWWTILPVYYTYVVKDHAAKLVPGLTQQPTRYIKTSDGSVWLVSDADINVSKPTNARSQIGLIKSNAEIHGFNAEFNSLDVEIVSIKESKIIVKSFNNRFGTNITKETDGFYSIDTNFSVQKLTDLSSYSAFIDAKGNTFLVNKGNSIKLVNSTQTWHRFDYTLKKLFNL